MCRQLLAMLLCGCEAQAEIFCPRNKLVQVDVRLNSLEPVSVVSGLELNQRTGIIPSEWTSSYNGEN